MFCFVQEANGFLLLLGLQVFLCLEKRIVTWASGLGNLPREFFAVKI